MDVHRIVYDPGLVWIDDEDGLEPEPGPEPLVISHGWISWRLTDHDDD